MSFSNLLKTVCNLRKLTTLLNRQDSCVVPENSSLTLLTKVLGRTGLTPPLKKAVGRTGLTHPLKKGVGGIFVYLAVIFFLVSCSDGILNSGSDSTFDSENKNDSSFKDTENNTDQDSDSEFSSGVCGRGVDVYGICWFLGAPFQSCTEVCQSRGGVDPNSFAYVGNPEQGGNRDKCSAILFYLLRVYGYVYSIQAPTAQGLGCYRFMDGNLYWIRDLAFNPNEKTYGVEVVCGCVRSDGN